MRWFYHNRPCAARHCLRARASRRRFPSPESVATTGAPPPGTAAATQSTSWAPGRVRAQALLGASGPQTEIGPLALSSFFKFLNSSNLQQVQKFV
jgi:hypothetical protein